MRATIITAIFATTALAAPFRGPAIATRTVSKRQDLSGVIDPVTGLVDDVVDTVTDTVDGVVDTVDGVVATVTDTLDDTTSAVNDLVPDLPTFPNIPLDLSNNPFDDLVDDVTGSTTVVKRQLPGLPVLPVLDLDLSAVTAILPTLETLLPTVNATLATVDATVQGLLAQVLAAAGVEVDLTADITSITSTLEGVISSLSVVDINSLITSLPVKSKRQEIAGLDLSTVNLDLGSLVGTVTGLLNDVVALSGSADVSGVFELVSQVLTTVTGLTSVLGL